MPYIEKAMKKRGFDLKTTALMMHVQESWLEEAVNGERTLSNLEMIRLAGTLGAGISEIAG